MSVMIRRTIALAILLVFTFVSCAMADFTPMDLNSVFESENGYHLELNVEILSHMPFSQERLSPLNELFRYLSVDADICGHSGSAILKINGEPQLTFVHKEENGETQEWTDALPLKVFCADQNTEPAEGYDSLFTPVSLDGMGFHGDEYAILNELQGILNNLPSLFPDVKQKEEKIGVRIGDFGTATRKRTLVISAEMAKQNELYRDVIAGNTTNQRLKELLESISFTGRQTLTQYIDEGDQVIRYVYAGNIRYFDGRVHNVNLSWKLFQSNNKELHEIKLKSPAASGNDRDNLTLTINWTHQDAEEHILILNYDYTRVRGKEKDLFQGETELALKNGEKTGLNGHVTLNRKHNNEKKQGWIFKPDVKVKANSNELTGQIEIDRTIGETAPESALIHINLRNGADVADIPDYIAEKVAVTDERSHSEAVSLLTEAAANKLIVPLLKLPEQALGYFKEGLTENQWNQIISSIQY